VAWARANAELSGLSTAPIRWIVEDAAKFVQRELRRGRQYDAVILDPPSYGHGPKGEVWRLAEQMPRLLEDCAELMRGAPRFALLTCHSPGFGPAALSEALAVAFPAIRAAQIDVEELGVKTADGRMLPCGAGAWIGAISRG
jgi:23S rRNA (cytosine1962-C5)-methyltransferase